MLIGVLFLLIYSLLRINTFLLTQHFTVVYYRISDLLHGKIALMKFMKVKRGKSALRNQDYYFYYKKGFLLVGISIFLRFLEGIMLHIVFSSISHYSYWVVTGCKVQIVIVSIVKSAMAADLISRICHFLQSIEIEIEDSNQKHDYCEYTWEICAEDISWYSLFTFYW